MEGICPGLWGWKLVYEQPNVHLVHKSVLLFTITLANLDQFQGRSQKFVSEGDKTWGQKSPSGSTGRALVGVWGLAEDIR